MRRARFQPGLIVALACVLLSGAARGADISAVAGQGNDPALVTLVGPLTLADIDAFNTAIAPYPKAIVAFSSPGGNLQAGLQIGTQIRMKGFSTLVLDNVRCASACALAWLGGAQRYMGPEARIGFHAAAIVRDGEAQATSAGNALIGAYLNRIGLPDRAVVFITDAAPNDIAWLTMADAEKLGIDVNLLRLPQAAPPDPAPTETSLAPEDAALVDRLARNFRKRLGEAGVGGLAESVAACYQTAAANGGEEPAIYCLALDMLAFRWGGPDAVGGWKSRAQDFIQQVSASDRGAQWIARAQAVSGMSFQRLRN